MASRDDYTVGLVCVLSVEVAAAKAMFDRLHDDLPADQMMNDTNTYALGILNGHNVVLAYPTSSVYGITSAAAVAAVACELHVGPVQPDGRHWRRSARYEGGYPSR